MATVLYTDMNCPFCYATECRLEALGVASRVEWRGIEHEPDLPVPILVDDEELNAEVAEEVRSVRARAPEVEIVEPTGKPNTAAALVLAAAAARTDADLGARIRRAVYRAFWVEGTDISQRHVLDGIAAEHGLAGLTARTEDDLEVASWRLEWERSPLRGVPLLLRDDGASLYGLKDAAELELFVAGG